MPNDQFEAARTQMRQTLVEYLWEDALNHAFDAGVVAQSWDALLCRPVLQRLHGYLSKGHYRVHDAAGANITSAWLSIIDAGLEAREVAEAAPTKTLKDLREAAGLSLEYVATVTCCSSPQNIKCCEDGKDWPGGRLSLAMAELYGEDFSVIDAAARASRKQRKESDDV